MKKLVALLSLLPIAASAHPGHGDMSFVSGETVWLLLGTLSAAAVFVGLFDKAVQKIYRRNSKRK